MRHYLAGLTTVLLAAGLANAAFADDTENARLREMLHRTQEALRQAQSDNADLTKAKGDAEQKLQDTSKQLDTVKSTTKTAQSSRASLQAKLNAAQNTQTSLQHNLDDANAHLISANNRIAEYARLLAARDAELKAVRQSLEQSEAANTHCEHNNAALYQYSTELLQRYRKKGVWSALAQKDPVFGLKEFDIENTVQEYQLKIEDQKIKP